MNTQEKTAEEQKRDIRLKENLARIEKKLIVISGKGGVGKTTFAVNLASALASRGKRTGILDVDIHGPNIAKMLGIEDRQLTATTSGIEPVQAAETSKAKACRAPISRWMKQAVLGYCISGVTVAQMMRSMSSAEMPAWSMAACAARTPMSDEAMSGSAMRRSLMPVRSTIQSLLVSTIFSRSAFVRTRSGRK